MVVTYSELSAELNIALVKGKTFGPLELTVSDDLTGRTYTAGVYSESGKIADMAVSVDGQVISITMTATESAKLTAGRATFWELSYTTDAGVVKKPYISGNVAVYAR